MSVIIVMAIRSLSCNCAIEFWLAKARLLSWTISVMPPSRNNPISSATISSISVNPFVCAWASGDVSVDHALGLHVQCVAIRRCQAPPLPGPLIAH